MKDLFGQAILDYQTQNAPEDLVTETNISEADEMSVAYLFRTYQEMPKIEKKALKLAKGKILDVGCGAGSHSLYLQQKGFDVTAIDISPNARYPVLGATLQRRAGTARHDAVAWGYARAASALGVDIIQNCKRRAHTTFVGAGKRTIRHDTFAYERHGNLRNLS